LAAGIVGSFFIINKFQWLLKYFIGAIGGMVIAILINPIGPAYISNFLFYIIAPVIAAVGIVFAHKKFKFTYICTTNILAAYLIVRGVSAFIGHYPNAIEFYSEYERSERGSIDVSFRVIGRGFL